jgi:hypothetical protein
VSGAIQKRLKNFMSLGKKADIAQGLLPLTTNFSWAVVLTSTGYANQECGYCCWKLIAVLPVC